MHPQMQARQQQTRPCKHVLNLKLFLIDRPWTSGWRSFVLIVPLFNFDILYMRVEGEGVSGMSGHIKPAWNTH